jgi:hypothetical protein
MILLQGEFYARTHRRPRAALTRSPDKFDLAEALQEFMFAVTVHGEDVLSHTNWEISENWLSRYSWVLYLPNIFPLWLMLSCSPEC